MAQGKKQYQSMVAKGPRVVATSDEDSLASSDDELVPLSKKKRHLKRERKEQRNMHRRKRLFDKLDELNVCSKPLNDIYMDVFNRFEQQHKNELDEIDLRES